MLRYRMYSSWLLNMTIYINDHFLCSSYGKIRAAQFQIEINPCLGFYYSTFLYELLHGKQHISTLDNGRLGDGQWSYPGPTTPTAMLSEQRIAPTIS